MVQWEMIEFKLNGVGAGKGATWEGLLEWEGFEHALKDQ